MNTSHKTAALLVALLSAQANAEFVEYEKLNMDSATNIAWLDVMETKPMTQSEIFASMEPGGVHEGFRMASQSEVYDLFSRVEETYSAVETLMRVFNIYEYSTYERTSTSHEYKYYGNAYYWRDDETVGNVELMRRHYRYKTSTYAPWQDAYQADINRHNTWTVPPQKEMGAFLVKNLSQQEFDSYAAGQAPAANDVSTPVSMALWGLGFLGAASLGRRTRNTRVQPSR
jgi:hypothetical protein